MNIEIILQYAQYLGIEDRPSEWDKSSDTESWRWACEIRDKQHRALMMEMVLLTKVIDSLIGVKEEEGVPAEMLGLFEEQQWPQLIVEFQPCMRIIEFKFNTMKQHKNLAETGLGVAVEEAPGHWLLYNKDANLMIRRLNPMDNQIISELKGAADMSHVVQETGIAHDTLKTKLVEWMNEGLIIDIGVPIPEGAEYAE